MVFSRLFRYFSYSCCLPSHRELERCAVADDAAGGGRGEMGADDEDRLIRPFGKEARAGQRGDLRVVVAERPVRMRQLAWMVRRVASDHRPLALKLDRSSTDFPWAQLTDFFRAVIGLFQIFFEFS